MTWADRILSFNQSLNITSKLPKGVDVLNPFQNPEALNLCKKFYSKYYSDEKPRTIILGINPGRFGAGLTGIPFTDPIKLETVCGISNTLVKKAELSSDFIYQVIAATGGTEKFYQRFYFSSISPLGFVKDGKNLNYYDIPKLRDSIYSFIVSTLKAQLAWNINRDVCYCLGEGKNYQFLDKLNLEFNFFKKVIPLAHPRYIMQYRRKHLKKFIDLYRQRFSESA